MYDNYGYTATMEAHMFAMVLFALIFWVFNCGMDPYGKEALRQRRLDILEHLSEQQRQLQGNKFDKGLDKGLEKINEIE